MPENVAEIRIWPNTEGERANGWQQWRWQIFGHRATVVEGSAATIPDALAGIAETLKCAQPPRGWAMVRDGDGIVKRWIEGYEANAEMDRAPAEEGMVPRGTVAVPVDVAEDLASLVEHVRQHYLKRAEGALGDTPDWDSSRESFFAATRLTKIGAILAAALKGDGAGG